MAKISALPFLAERLGTETIPVVTGLEGERETRQLALSDLLDNALLLAFSSTDVTLGGAAPSNELVPTQKAVVTFIAARIAALVASSPAQLDTLNELAAALGNDANFAATMTAALAGKVSAAQLAAAVAEATNAEAWAGLSATKLLTPRRLFGMSAPQALVDSASIAVDLAAGINFKVTIAGNRTLANPTNGKPGQSGLIKVTQDATGGRTLAYGSAWRFVGGVGALSTAAGAVDLISYLVDDDGTLLCSLGKDVKAPTA